MVLMWGGFLAFVLLVLALDLGVFNRKPHAPSMREALGFTAMTVALALGFAGFIYIAYNNQWEGLGTTIDAVDRQTNTGRLAMVKFLTGYIVELSLSMDNVFVIALIFEHLRVPLAFQHRVLFWGILGALAMRGLMIAIGAALVARYHWILYVFGVFLIITAVRMLLVKEAEAKPEQSWIVRWLKRWFRVTRKYYGTHFVISRGSIKALTPLAVALVLVEATDVLFAVDSIPAIFAITADPFLVFTSNVFAILCLRSLYFGLAGLIEKFKYLKTSLALILGVVGIKMLAGPVIKAVFGEHVNLWMLVTVGGILIAGAVASVIAEQREKRSAS